MANAEKPVASFILSLIGGIFIFVGGVIMSFFAFGAVNMMSMGMMTNMMSSMQLGMGMMMLAPGFAIVGLASGTIVVFGAAMLYSRPSESQIWGAFILAFSVVSILGGMGGFLVGLILGLVGGFLALTWRPTPVARDHPNTTPL